MKKTIFVFLILIISINPIYSQIDSLRSQISKVEDSNYILALKARQLLLARLKNDEKEKALELKNYLLNNLKEKNDNLSLWEIITIDYLTDNFSEIFNLSENSLSQSCRVSTPPDNISNDFYKLLISRYKIILNSIDKTNLSDDYKDFLKLDLNIHVNWNKIEQEEKNILGKAFIEKYPNSRFNNYLKQNVIYETKPSKCRADLFFEMTSKISIFALSA